MCLCAFVDVMSLKCVGACNALRNEGGRKRQRMIEIRVRNKEGEWKDRWRLQRADKKMSNPSIQKLKGGVHLLNDGGYGEAKIARVILLIFGEVITFPGLLLVKRNNNRLSYFFLNP